MTNLEDALKSINWMKAAYFRYKFPELRYDQSRPLKSEEEFLRFVNRKSVNSFVHWEKSQEYKNLIQLYLDTKIADDLQEIYEIVTENAKKGDDKSVRLFLSMQKDIQSNAKLASKTFKVKDEENDDSDDFELDLD